MSLRGGGEEASLPDAPAETVAMWVEIVSTMNADVLESFARRTLGQWSAASLRPLVAAIDARRAELGKPGMTPR